VAENTSTEARRLHALSIAAYESETMANEDRETRDRAIFEAYDSGRWTLKQLAKVTEISLTNVHRIIRKQAETD